MTTQQWLDRMVRRFGSYAALARFLKVYKGNVSHWKHGRVTPSARVLALTGYEWQICKRK